MDSLTKLRIKHMWNHYPGQKLKDGWDLGSPHDLYLADPPFSYQRRPQPHFHAISPALHLYFHHLRKQSLILTHTAESNSAWL